MVDDNTALNWHRSLMILISMKIDKIRFVPTDLFGESGANCFFFEFIKKKVVAICLVFD